MNKSKKTAFDTLNVGNAQILTHKTHPLKLHDPYHTVLTLSWTRFFILLLFAFFVVNMFFGTIYWLIPGSVVNTSHENFLNYFFFSIETLATVGYGVMSPANLAGHIVASFEILSGMVAVALVTGIVFVRFSKPTARILFSDVAVIRNFEGNRVLMIRIANERYNQIVEATAKLNLVRMEINTQGERFLRIHDLPLVRERSPVFRLTWTLIHTIDTSSPLFGQEPEMLAETYSRITLNVTGQDETMAAPVFASKIYEAEDLAFDYRFVDILNITSDGQRIINLTKFHNIVEDTLET